MPTTKPEKAFDAVKFMREAREKLSAQLRNKTFEEQKRFLKEQSALRKREEQVRPEQPPDPKST